MQKDNLVLRLMNTKVSCPRTEIFDFLKSIGISKSIMQKYHSPEDSSEAFDGACVGFHVQAHLSQGAPKEEWLNEILGWYDIEGRKELDGPFYFGLQKTLEACNLTGFYKEVLDFIELNEGRLD